MPRRWRRRSPLQRRDAVESGFHRGDAEDTEKLTTACLTPAVTGLSQTVPPDSGADRTMLSAISLAGEEGPEVGGVRGAE